MRVLAHLAFKTYPDRPDGKRYHDRRQNDEIETPANDLNRLTYRECRENDDEDEGADHRPRQGSQNPLTGGDVVGMIDKGGFDLRSFGTCRFSTGSALAQEVTSGIGGDR